MDLKGLRIACFALLPWATAAAQMPARNQSANPSSQAQPSALPEFDQSTRYERDLHEAVALTSRGQFELAIPHFLAARGNKPGSFVLEFNLALCYVGTRQWSEAIKILAPLRGRRVNVKILLTQAYVGARQSDAALQAFDEAVGIEPKNERLYLQVAQTCLEESDLELAGHALDTGLTHLPQSARLHFERGVLGARQGDNELANADFAAAATLAPGTEIAYIAASEQSFLAGDMTKVIRAAREGIQAGRRHYLLLTLLGEALLRSGAEPGEAEFAEAQTALEQAVVAQPGYSSSHIALGRVYLALAQLPEAIAQFDVARQLDPRNRAIYQPLAAAYRRAGQPDQAKAALATLAELNRDEAERIRTADSDHTAYRSGRPPSSTKPKD